MKWIKNISFTYLAMILFFNNPKSFKVDFKYCENKAKCKTKEFGFTGRKRK